MKSDGAEDDGPQPMANTKKSLNDVMKSVDTDVVSYINLPYFIKLIHNSLLMKAKESFSRLRKNLLENYSPATTRGVLPHSNFKAT